MWLNTIIILHSDASISLEVSSIIKLLINTPSNWEKFFLYSFNWWPLFRAHFLCFFLFLCSFSSLSQLTVLFASDWTFSITAIKKPVVKSTSDLVQIHLGPHSKSWEPRWIHLFFSLVSTIWKTGFEASVFTEASTSSTTPSFSSVWTEHVE